MAAILVPGPAEIHCGVGSGGTLAFLGWSEAGVRLNHYHFWEDVHADIAGPQMPADTQYQGAVGNISLDLKVANWAVFEAIASRGNPRGGVAGALPAGHIGGLMATEGAAFRLLVYPPFVAKAIMRAGGLRPYSYPVAWLAGPDDFDYSTRPLKMRCVFKAISRYDPRDGSWLLYNADSSGKPAAV